MKKIILSLIAGTMLSSTAFAMDTINVSNLQLPAEGQVCSDIHDRNTGGINVKELSPYNQCVMVENDINTGFTYKTFWTKVGDKIIPHDVEDLADQSRPERVKMIQDTIIQEIIVEKIKEVIIEDTAKIEALEKDIAAKKTSIEFLQRANKSLLGTNADLSSQIEALEGQLSQRTYDLRQAEKKIAQLEEALVASYTADDLAAAKQLAFTENRVSTNLEADPRPNSVEERPSYVGGSNKSGKTINDVEVTTEEGFFNNTVYNITLDGKQKVRANVLTAGQAIDDIVAEVAEFVYTEAYIDGFTDGYKDGYNDGYDDGYADGYKDGFADGVASVK